jgi:hypothetical protein
MKNTVLSPNVKEMITRVGEHSKNGAVIHLFVENSKDASDETIAHDFNLMERISEGDSTLGRITINSFDGM